MAEAKEILDKLKDLKSTSNSLEMKRRKGTINGALIGMAGGLLVGLTRNYNLISSAVVGALLGGLVATVILPKNDE
jgi:drug/metabolite transporter (DMT)-like permease